LSIWELSIWKVFFEIGVFELSFVKCRGFVIVKKKVHLLHYMPDVLYLHN